MAMAHDHKLAEKWEHNRDVGLLLLRIILGGVLMVKGYRFLFHTADITNLLSFTHESPLASIVTWIIIFANLAGGLFIFLGLLTRVMCVIQIPILIGAMILNMSVHVLNSSEWMLTFVTFFLIVYLYIFGSGKYSLGYVFLKAPPESSTMGDED